MRDEDEAAFSRPGGEACGAAPARPIDLAHLARQTMDDRDLEREVLSLFVQQALSVRDNITEASAEQKRFLAHGLKGAARGVGAFAIAEWAGRVESDPDDSRDLHRLPSDRGSSRGHRGNRPLGPIQLDPAVPGIEFFPKSVTVRRFRAAVDLSA